MSSTRPALAGEITLEEASKRGLISEINRLLLHPAGYRLVLVRPTQEMSEEAAEQGWPEPGLSLAFIDASAEKGGLVFSDDAVAAHTDLMLSGAKHMAERTLSRRPDRTERYSCHRQQIPGYDDLG